MEAKDKDMPKNVQAAFAYLLGPFSGLYFLIFKDDAFVRFHAMQSIILFVSVILLIWFMAFSFIFLGLIPLIVIFVFIIWLMLIYKSWNGEEWEIPYLGRYARKLLK
jgi:uncharacterized membrane protein